MKGSTPLRERKMNFLVNFIVIGFAFAVFFHCFVQAINSHSSQNASFVSGINNIKIMKNTIANYSQASFIFDQYPYIFGDFAGSYKECVGLNPYFSDYPIHSNYFPFANAIDFLFTLVPLPAAFALFMIVLVVSMFFFCRKYLSSEDPFANVRGLFVFSFMTYPFLYLFFRANMEFFVFFFLFFFFYFYQKKEFALSALFLALAAAMKGFPLILVLLYLPAKRYKEIFVVAISAILLTAISLLFHKGGFMTNLNYVLSGFDAKNSLNTGAFIYGDFVQKSVSLFVLLKMALIEAGWFSRIDPHTFLTFYSAVVLVLTLLITAYVVFIEKELWKITAMTILAMILFPHISADYKLIHLFFPLFFYVNSRKEDRFDLAYLTIFGLLLIPKAYYVFSGIITPSGRDIPISAPINILLIMAMMGLLAYSSTIDYLSAKRSSNRKKGS